MYYHHFLPPSARPNSLKDIYTDSPPLDNQRVKLASSAPFTPTYVKSAVTQSTNPEQVYASRVRGRQLLLENPVRDSKAKKERELKKARRLADKAKKATSESDRRNVQSREIWKLKPEEIRFSLYLPLHMLWLGYMSELLALGPVPSTSIDPGTELAPTVAGMHAKLVKADYHGSIMTVRQSKNPCLVGLSGIVIHETENAFKIVTKSNRLKLIPKQNTVFAFAVPLYSISPSASRSPGHDSAIANPTDDIAASASSEALQTVLDIPHMEFELYGNQFCFRASERASRKFKHKETIEL